MDPQGNWVWKDTTHHRYEHLRQTDFRDMLHLTDSFSVEDKNGTMGRKIL